MMREDVVPRSEFAEDMVAEPCNDNKSPFDLLRKSKASVEEIVERMLSIKKEGNSKSENPQLLMKMFLTFVNLRQANRVILTEEDKEKAEGELAKSTIDVTTLQLHSLMYEKSHYIKAINASRDFKSTYPSIDLISEQEFFQAAPEEIKAQKLSDHTSHDLTLKILNFELHQRKELCEFRARLEQRKKFLLESNAERKKSLSSLPLLLKSLKKASLPVQNQLCLQHTIKLKQHNLAEMLPPPLYLIYSQFMAQKEAFEDSIDLEVSGSLKDVQTYARHQSEKHLGILNDGESSRLDDDGPDDVDDEQRQRKRPKKVDSGLDQVHPLKILLHIYDDEIPDPKSRKLVTVKFEYLLTLNVVCVGTEGPQGELKENFLSNLFPDDAGLELPHQSAKLILGDGQAFDEKRTSRPYKWAQYLAGIEILPEMSPFLSGNDTQNSDTERGYVFASDLYRVQTVLQRIRSQKKT